MRCHLLIPASAWETIPRETRVPSLESLLARGETKRNPTIDLPSWLRAAFGMGEDPDAPFASLRLRGEGIDPGTDYWLCADPVHLMVARDGLILSPVTPRADEAAALVGALNTHFGGDGLEFQAPTADRWYLRVAWETAIATHPLDAVIGRDVHPLLPHGPDAMRWRALLNEIQMLLFHAAPNAAREERGEWPLNSLWLWGGGRAPTTLSRPFAHVWSDLPLVKGCAGASGALVGARPEDAESWFAKADAGDHLLVLDGWPDADMLERRWFAPLRKMLGHRLTELTIHLPNGVNTLECVCHASSRWKFWRRARPLSDYRV